jgi:hypothetical protein
MGIAMAMASPATMPIARSEFANRLESRSRSSYDIVRMSPPSAW